MLKLGNFGRHPRCQALGQPVECLKPCPGLIAGCRSEEDPAEEEPVEEDQPSDGSGVFVVAFVLEVFDDTLSGAAVELIA
jgi:hypothetical protein